MGLNVERVIRAANDCVNRIAADELAKLAAAFLTENPGLKAKDCEIFISPSIGFRGFTIRIRKAK